MAALVKTDPARRRKTLTDENLWALLKERFREWPEARRAARIEYLQDVHKDATKAENEPAKPAQETLAL